MIDREKPLEQWTLGDARDECRLNDLCTPKCFFYAAEGSSMCILKNQTPNHWEFRDRRLSDSELSIMQAVGAKCVSRNSDRDIVELWDTMPSSEKKNGVNIFGQGQRPLAAMLARLFPSVNPGACIVFKQEGTI